MPLELAVSGGIIILTVAAGDHDYANAFLECPG